MFGKALQCRACGNFKIGDRLTAIGAVAAIKQLCERRFADQFTGNADAFMEFREMRRGIGMNSSPRPFETCADHGLRAAFAIGAGQMNDAWQPVLRVIQSTQKPPHPVQSQINDLRMKGHHPLEDDVRIS